MIISDKDTKHKFELAKVCDFKVFIECVLE